MQLGMPSPAMRHWSHLLGENTMPLPNLMKSRNHVSSALMAEVIAVVFAVARRLLKRPILGSSLDSLSLIKLLKNGGSQPNFSYHV
ncbi:hypothetical protein Bca52824_043944 [Brassica carinata]|uniref:Uncharacterized protein n=1 Tax=Brassica carinata TaxID=52824 RepID=A0A8X7RZK4_BRACI|nr:hypothetical protein Bca52824_043944 [Brassica carinata]